jgi:tRNA wybutosine-synthesizing protein 3
MQEYLSFMTRDNFLQRKNAVLSKLDRSSIGKWDDKIISLCDKINSSNDFYTTSSCLGRIIVMVDQMKKGPGLFEFISHDVVNLENFMKCIPKEQSKLNLKFKSEPPILHIVCRNLKLASDILEKAKNAGWKHSGIISAGDSIVVEIASTEKLEFPLTKNGKLLVDKVFLDIVLEKANEKLKNGWKKIEKFEKII